MLKRVISFGKFHDLISRNEMPFVAALGSRLAEIGVRGTFLLVTSIATIFLEELENKIQLLAENSDDQSDRSSANAKNMPKDLEEWKIQYELIARYIHQINKSFGVVLLLILIVDQYVAAIECFNIMVTWDEPRYYFNFLHILSRFLLITFASSRIESKV